MNWLLILFIVAVVLSPLMWIKQTPHQRRITLVRQYAAQRGVRVNLNRRPDAREDEKRLETVKYWLPWADSGRPQSYNWVLHNYSQRGWESPFSGWRWTIAQAAGQWQGPIQVLLDDLPEGVSAVISDAAGIGVIWDEKGDKEQVEQLCNALQVLHKSPV